MKLGGACIAWQQALGNSCLAAAIILLQHIHFGLVAMPAYLFDEYANRLHSAGFADDQWQSIDGSARCHVLRRLDTVAEAVVWSDLPHAFPMFGTRWSRRLPRRDRRFHRRGAPGSPRP